VSSDIVGVVWRKPVLIHASCVVDIAGFGEIDKISDLRLYVARSAILNEPMKCAFNR